MDSVRRFPPILVGTHRAPARAYPPASCDTGRAAAGRAGSFNPERSATIEALAQKALSAK
jgi:hypothetical protein